jgi:cytochrome c
MKKGLLISALAATALLSGGVQASEELAKKHNCLACHKVDAKLVGPSYQEIAGKYKTEDAGKLMEKVKKGGSGAWGQIPMPPNPNVSDDDLKTLVNWVLAQKK